MIHVVREAAGEPAGTVILLHGRGADEHDLLPLLGVLDPKRRLRGITVGAPLAMPPGGKHWYAVHRVGHPDPATFAPTYAELTSFLDTELAVDWSQTVIGGFSQGGVMSYAVGLGPGRPVPAGVLAMSSFIPRFDDGSWEPDFATRPQLHVAHVHGEGDPVIGVEFGRDARDRISAAGLPLLYREFPGGHHVDPRLLPVLADWLSQRFS
ncbi:MAG: phospholipase/carboxylesterase [Solirubrobacteraceae bacterium]|nr:phospholipase/carboxylesterase [Solirubrobacteraceae bacterium]